MGIIRQLPREVVEKIAAGEVVERPASVVKELVENAIDAGAGSVSVCVDGGGQELIRVRDDGCGMDEGDLALCVRPHATSKISSADDLWRVATMGFRGEALASIASISRVEIVSRPAGAQADGGARIAVEYGAIVRREPAGCAAGTEVAVRKLFHNVPARKKFMKSDRVESAHAVDAVVRLALAFPRVRFEVSVDGVRRHSFAAADPAARAAQVLGGSVSLIEVREESPDISVRGLIADEGRSAGRDVYLYVNGRPVKDRTIMHALLQAFGERLPRGRTPSAVLWIDCDPARVDVNVHPTKREVKFADGGAVHSFVTSAVRKSLGRTETVVAAAAPIKRPEEPTPRARMVPEGEARPLPGVADFSTRMRPLGQFGGTYVACDDPDGALVIIDQHAAHERLGFDELARQHSKGGVVSQRLLIPEQVELSEGDCASLVERSDIVAAAGFEVEPFGGGTVVVKAVPAMLGGVSVAPVMEELARELADFGASESAEDAVHRVLALIACHGQVRAGDRLGPQEVAALVRDVEEKGVKTCPHGRPAVIRVEKGEIEKWFKRS